jgi:hypothetical protein
MKDGLIERLMNFWGFVAKIPEARRVRTDGSAGSPKEYMDQDRYVQQLKRENELLKSAW